MKFEIKRMKNGWKLKTEDSEDPGVVGVDSYDNEEECFAAFLRDILTHYGPSDGRYSSKRIMVKIEPGDHTAGMSEDDDYIISDVINRLEGEPLEKVLKELKEDLKKSIKYKKENGYTWL